MNWLSKYVPSGSTAYGIVASLAGILSLWGAQIGVGPLEVLSQALISLELPSEWLTMSCQWIVARSELVGAVGMVLFLLGWIGCGGNSARDSRAGSSAVLGGALCLSVGVGSVQLGIVLILVRVGIEWIRSRKGSGDAGSSFLGFFFGTFGAALSLLSWLVGNSRQQASGLG